MMTHTSLAGTVAMIAAAMALTACSSPQPAATPSATSAPATATTAAATSTAARATSTPAATSSATAAPAAAGFKDATYEVAGKPVKLVNGVSEVEAAPGSASKVITRYFGNEATGDLNGDGVADVGFVLTQTTGGSGTFYYAVAALKTADGWTGTNAVLLGDRIAPQSTSLAGGVLTVNYADRKPGEPMTTQPSVGVSKRLKVTAGKLAEQ